MVGLAIQRKGPGTYEVVAESDLGADATLYWYRDGELVAVGSGRYMTFDVGPGEVLQVEVLDDSEALPALAHPGVVVLQWDRVQGAGGYRVERWNGTAWVVERTITTTAFDVGVYRWDSGALEDGVLYRFRVVPVSQVESTNVDRAGGLPGNAGTAREWQGLLVRRPSAVSFSASLVGGVLEVG